MKTTDELSECYQDILDGQYDCVDRIVLNAYYVLGQTPGGFRTWWRQVHGSDENLNETMVMRYAGRFARRVRAHAENNGIPVLQCGRGERKHEVAAPYVPTDPDYHGVFCILYGRAPAPVREIKRFGQGGIDIRIKHPWPYVNHYHFHIMDPEWGHLIIRICPHPPFTANIILNGHEYVERLARKRKLDFTKEGNCFTHFSNATGLAGVAETMTHGNAGVGRLAKVCERWIYSSCLCFALDLDEQERCAFRYRYSVYQAEYSRNYLFERGREMEKLFDGLIDRTRTALDIRSLKTIFGVTRRPCFRGPNGKRPRIELTVERPAYDLTVFKIHFGLLTIKMYSKGERVLRVEVIIHNARRMNCGVGIDKFPAIVAELKAILERFVQTLCCVDVSFIDATALDKWPKRSNLAGRPVAGVDINQPRTQAVLQAVVAVAANPNGFKVSELAERVRRSPEPTLHQYTSRQASYDLRKLRAKGVVKRIPGSLRYAIQPKGLRSAVALLVLRNKVLVPLLAQQGKRHRSPRCHMSPIDIRYDNIQKEMQHAFKILGIAA
jgi:hypothetical protein